MKRKDEKMAEENVVEKDDCYLFHTAWSEWFAAAAGFRWYRPDKNAEWELQQAWVGQISGEIDWRPLERVTGDMENKET